MFWDRQTLYAAVLALTDDDRGQPFFKYARTLRVICVVQSPIVAEQEQYA